MDIFSILQSSFDDALLLLFVLLLTVFVIVMLTRDPKCIPSLLGLSEKHEVLKFLGIGMGGLLLALEVSAMKDAANEQAKATAELAKANQNTERGQQQERLKNAIEHLDRRSGSVRLGAAYELFHLAQDAPELSQTVMDILCAHIRQKTGESKYQAGYKIRPSAEIQTILTLLFVRDPVIFQGHRADLRRSWLRGANLSKAQLQGAKLDHAQLQGAVLRHAQLQGDLQHAQLQGAKLAHTQLQGAQLGHTQLQGTELRHAQLQGAMLAHAQLQGAELLWTQLKGAVLTHAQLQGAVFNHAQLQGADLYEAQLQGVTFYETQLQGATLSGTQLQGTTNNKGSYLSEFTERIRETIDRQSDLSGVIFQGGLKREDLNFPLEVVPAETANMLRARLESQVGQEPSHDLPADSGAMTGTYTKEGAEAWIADYEKAMSKVPVRDRN